VRKKKGSEFPAWLRSHDIRSRNGNHFFRGPLYSILRNSHYIGRIKHKKETYPGEHTAIVDQQTWNKVQALLNSNIQGERRKMRATKESLFTGILFDIAGMRYTPTHASKSGRHYRYYTSQAAFKKTGQSDAPARIPAPDIEKAVVDRLLEWFENPEQLLTAIHDQTDPAPRPEGLFDRLIARAATTAQRWRERIAEDRTEFLKNVIERVIIHSDHVEFRLRVPALVNEILGGKSTTLGLTKTASIECPFRHVRQGRAVRLVVGESSLTTDVSRKAILKAIARARTRYEQLTTGKAESIAQLASMHGLSARFINLHIKLIPLSPESIEKMMTKSRAMPISLDDLLHSIPMNWSEQAVGVASK
jgi:hypothetical protein